MDEYDCGLTFDATSAYNFSLNLKISKISDAELTISCHKPITMKDTGLKKVRPIVSMVTRKSQNMQILR